MVWLECDTVQHLHTLELGGVRLDIEVPNKLVDRLLITVLDCSSYLVIARIALGYPRDENTSFLGTLYDVSNVGFISGSVFGGFDGPSPTCGRCC